MGINIKADSQHLTNLNIERSNAIGAENLKSTLLRILFHCFQQISSDFPLTTRAL